ncbi:TPA: hypothetical protein CPT96_12235 [Candidatus Gastranaerophilales bacterium HUM_10]|nr:MAG TPA: hypothetical protein CPT96_12235 [Candidatus Gastranaerophilales bacterium HUM_10]
MPKSDGYKNLIPTNKLSKDEARMLGQKGGIKSGEVRRMRKSLKEQLLLLLSENEIQENICLSLIDKALDGDVQVFKLIRDTIGEKPVERFSTTELSINLTQSYNEVKALMEAEKQRAISEQKILLLDDIED